MDAHICADLKKVQTTGGFPLGTVQADDAPRLRGAIA